MYTYIYIYIFTDLSEPQVPALELVARVPHLLRMSKATMQRTRDGLQSELGLTDEETNALLARDPQVLTCRFKERYA